MNRAFILVLDSFGIGSTEDAIYFGDIGSNTFGSIANFCYKQKKQGYRKNSLRIPNLMSLGLGHAYFKLHNAFPAGLEDNGSSLLGSYGYAKEISSGKDTSSGHWEIAGIPILFNWDYFVHKKNSFPQDLLDKIMQLSNIKGYLGNCHASGTDILVELGLQHINSGYPIFYTSIDSVFQVACHEDVFSLEKLYSLCDIIRKLLDKDKYKISRVIARPFSGQSKSNFTRTNNRKDFSIVPNGTTVMNKLVNEKKGTITGIGKISDIYGGSGITHEIKAYGLKNLAETTIRCIKYAKNNSMIITNFVDFDSLWGHRRDIQGYAIGLELFDRYLLQILSIIQDNDLLIITADHGCDPSWKGTDHTREHVPILIYKKNLPVQFLGYRKTFADISQTIARYFELSSMYYGHSMF
ncbi:Phosphopentomutase [Buchnera aphidicola (Thelaxes suberi)]|uniref:phosphopentomutase n=1 Tax=Buchnera aphidicola TaxID=9 RepID=UPI0034640A28